ncbi:MAG TPA: DNA ligase D [Terracidiphilus sp.]|jgi:bifunctional non-homologous end joining protein LigD
MARKQASRKPAQSTEKQLARYQSMRDFDVTREPSGQEVQGSSAPAEELPFVIQKHAATRLHYDFRLGWNGVLKSWAVTKGPSYVPGDKRLAVQVEDHPMEYGGFEGIIPKGQYGGGTVMLWDRGTWEPHVDVDEGLRKGSLKFAMHGEKMKGNWALVRMGGRAANESKPNWLLIKEHDAEERTAEDQSIVDEAPDSVLSGRTMDAIARDGDRVWQSNRSQVPESQASVVPSSRSESGKVQKGRTKPNRDQSRLLARAPKEALPAFVSPQLASLGKAPPVGDNWVHELKLDGYRIQARIDGKKSTVQMLTRTGLDWTHRMEPIAESLHKITAQSAVLDGEVVVLDADGTTSFANLQAAFQDGAKHTLIYFVFDLLHLDGHNLRNLPLVDRKKLLFDLLATEGIPANIRKSEHIEGDANEIFHHACKLGSEGIVSKLASDRYASGRSGSWLKLKCYQEQEFVIGGFTLPSNGTHGVGALLLGYYRAGKLTYAGRTGTGFTQKTHRMLRDRLDKLKRSTIAFEDVPSGQGRGVHWVKPELVAQVSFSTWTADNLVRQAAFKGLREDKPAQSVTREVPQPDRDETRPDEKENDAGRATVKPGRLAKSEKSESLPIRLTHPAKILDESSGVTKEALAHYYLSIAEVILPYIADRPLTLVRCPEGSSKQCFYQKHKNQMLGGSFESVEVVDKKSGKPEPYITLSQPQAVVELAQIGVLEVHPWGSRNESLEHPDQIIFDLDPDEAIPWQTLASSALEIRKRLKALNLTCFVKSTGGKGLHVVIPILPEHSWAAVKQFAHNFVLTMEKEKPSLYLTKMTKAARKGKIYLDYLRNERGSTAVAPFSPRARAGLPVAMPLSWTELNSEGHPHYRVSDFRDWKKRLARNPWKEMAKLQQRLTLPDSK